MPAPSDLLSYSLALRFAICLQDVIDKNDHIPKERVLRESRPRNGIAA